MTIQSSDKCIGKPQITLADWGRTRYEDALERQMALVESRLRSEAGDTLVFTEHDPVFTIGKRKGAANNLVWSEEQLAGSGIRVATTNRGGDITYHGPGQIVCYPVISLERCKDLHVYLRKLEDVVIRTLAGYGLSAGRREGKTGIWLNDRKICAIGVAIRSWVTYHGFALNVAPDLGHFSGIVPCGITDGTVTSMKAELGEVPVDETLKASIAVEFTRVFSDILPLDERT